MNVRTNKVHGLWPIDCSECALIGTIFFWEIKHMPCALWPALALSVVIRPLLDFEHMDVSSTCEHGQIQCSRKAYLGAESRRYSLYSRMIMIANIKQVATAAGSRDVSNPHRFACTHLNRMLFHIASKNESTTLGNCVYKAHLHQGEHELSLVPSQGTISGWCTSNLWSHNQT